MAMRIYIFIFVLFLFESCDCCNKKSISQIDILIKSTNSTDLIEAYNSLNSISDTIFLGDIFKNPYDMRISHDLRFKGISVYQAKMMALQRISGFKPPHEIDYEIDTVNINFYIEWALKKGYINK